MHRMCGVVVALTLAVAGRPGSAQEVTLSAGPAGYDLSGTGTSWAASARYGHPMTGPLSLEAGFSTFRYETQGGAKVTFLMPEVGLTLTAPVRSAAILLTAGGGYAAVVEGHAEGDPTLFASLGLDLPLAGPVRLRPSLRVRVVDPWVGTIGEYNLGVRIPLSS